ncbi:unnamed protein product [Larinioides sclopetarius]|uniref:Sema domain-containing protein n=1 Tax=Larinioides sclopetarius TaxID=280406 RepID=A0AAV2B1H1_9ARAC
MSSEITYFPSEEEDDEQVQECPCPSEERKKRKRRTVKTSGQPFFINVFHTVLLAAWATSICHAQHEGSVVASYRTYNDSINFTHVVVDYQTGRVYVGATNWLYQFNSSLDVESNVRTGPVEDSIQCFPTGCSDQQLSTANNVNKVLVIDHEAGMLIACGSVHQGACRRHSLQDIGNYEKLLPVPVAANDENSSTYAFIGPARYQGLLPSRVLYVATTNSRLGPYRDVVPAICSRSLEPNKLFTIIERSFSSIARVDVSFHLRDYYLVNYIYGFHSGDYVYYATVQRKSHLRALEEWGYITRLSRVCVSDVGYDTYTEVTLQCLGEDGTDFNLLQDASVIRAGGDLAADLHIDPGSDVLVGVFAASKDHTTRPSAHSALCVYSMAEIEQRFTENIHMCYNGSVLTRDMDYIAGSINQCPEPGKAGNILNFCNETVKLNGSVPISAMAAIVYSNTTLTGVALAVTGQHTVAFSGTGDGALKKLLITNSMEAEEFEEVVVDSGNPIIADVALDPTQQYIYAASPYKISKIRIEACQQYNTCDKCLQARNPYCGWCSLERRCTIKAACQNATWSFSDRSSPRWLSLETKQCIDFQAVRPDQLPYNSMSFVELDIHQLPQLPYGAHYLCVFGESSPIQARVTHSGLACMTPLVTARPPILPNDDHVIVNLAVRSSETETDFIHRPFVFYDCEVHKTCKACVTSTWACSWCVHENTCTSNATTCARRVIVGESNPQNSLIKGRQHCPSFNIDDEILLPNGVRKEISIGVKNLLTPLEGFQCVVEIEGAKERVFARVRDNTVICAENMYTYEAEIGQVQASLTVLWNGDTFIDKTNVTLYKCHLLGSHGGRADCSLCMTRERKYQCAWCGTSCSYSESCIDPVATSCPPPHIDWIHPLSGPLEGGTLVTIEGSNLGSSEEEIQDKVTIGGIPCIPVEYSISVRIVCRTGVNLSGPMPAVVVVGNRAGVTRAQEKFHYKAVELTGVYPNVGPQSGGTRLYLKGSNLNIGSHVEIMLDDLPCRVERSLASSSQISCRTTRSPVPSYEVSQLILRIDGANITYPNPFTYTADPTLRYIHPLKSFMSGGRYVKVMGTNLTSVQQPRMVVFNEHNVVNETVCHVTNASTMLCPSPAVRPDSLKLRSQHWRSYDEMRLKIGFIMDDVQPVREMQNYFPTLPNEIIYVPDPKFYVLSKDGVKLYKGESLVIEGENMRLASTEGEINVTIGTRPCNLTSLSMTQLVCLPPEAQPSGTDEMGRKTENSLPLVVVRAGTNLRYQIGYLRYEVAKTYEFPPEAIGGIAAGAAILIVLSLIILAALRHKSSQAEREYKRIQLQMDTLENSVRSECKQAFAELQTDMSDLNNDIQATGVPTLDHRTFVMKVFFPGVTDNPVIEECKQINGPQNMYEIAMAQFEQLLCNRNFLLVFIETLEEQKSFSIRDKVNVASLLMIIFLEKMEYATSILKELLLRLIDKYVGTKHPQLMLRRTESVVEKMLTNWMALCMYNYIKDQAGGSLFLLFSAIKHQVEKGPVDVITHDARYSLSEERLLREQIEYSPVTIQVIHEDQDEKIQCKVNDCDTISQVKAKILDYLYKNTPFSQRPSIYDVDLEWRHGRGGHLILADEDLTTKVVNGWKRINTLAHYGIRESAVMCLVARRKDMMNCLRSTFNGPLISGSPHLGNCIEDGPRLRYWHLVKNMDDHHDFQKDHSHKAIPEIFLTRLLSTKGTIQKFVDDFLTTILSAKESLPPAVKWLFDLFDEAAARYGISDPEVVHAWKSNSLPLRFWVNLVKNPDFVFDIEKTPIVDSCLSVIAQTFMDSCSTSEHRLGKDSPSNKLLFARDIPTYRKMVNRFYQDVANLPAVTEQEMCVSLQMLSMAHAGEVDSVNALKELYIYVSRYGNQILEALDTDPVCQSQHLAGKLETVAYTIGGGEASLC